MTYIVSKTICIYINDSKIMHPLFHYNNINAFNVKYPAFLYYGPISYGPLYDYIMNIMHMKLVNLKTIKWIHLETCN